MRQAINSCFVTFVPPPSGFVMAIYYTLYGICQTRSQDSRTYVRKKIGKFWFHPLPAVWKPIASSIYYKSHTSLCT